MKNILLSTSAALLLTGVTVANAEVYVGATAGAADHGYDNVDSSTATKAFVGYQFADSNWGVEAAVVDLGSAKIKATNSKIETDGQQFAVVYSTNSLKESAGNFYVKVGGYSLDTKITNAGPGNTDSSSGLMWGLGGRYVLIKGLSILGEISGYNNVSNVTDKQTATTFDVGLQYNF